MVIEVGQKAPNLKVSGWIGKPTNIDEQKGNVVLVSVFQVNCPGAIVHSLPNAIKMHDKFSGSQFSVIGLATAFEDFELNNLDNLKLLIEKGKTVGDTKKYIKQKKFWSGGNWSEKVEFPIGVDNLVAPPKELEFMKRYAQTFWEYGLMGTPYTLLIDKEGILRYRSMESEGIEDQIKQLLKA